MDRNSIIGFALIILIFFGYVAYNSQRAKELKKNQQAKKEAVQPNTAPADTLSGSRSTTVKVDTPSQLTDTVKAPVAGVFQAALTGQNDTIILENELIKISLNTKGGAVSKVELKKYKTFNKAPLVLMQGAENEQTFIFYQNGISQPLQTKDFYFQTDGPKKQGDKTVVALRLPTGNGYFEQVYTLSPNSYQVGYEVNVVNLDKVIPTNARSITILWNRLVPLLERDKTSENKYTNLHYKVKDGSVNHLSETEDDEKVAEAPLSFITYKQQFFNTTLHIKDESGLQSGKLESKIVGENKYLKEFIAQVSLPYNHSPSVSYHMDYYFGPNHYQTLKKLDIDLEETIKMGWFSFINTWIIIPIFNWLEQYVSNYGWIILILTIIIKVLLTPLTYRSQLSMAKMKVLKPELDELKEKYKDDQQKFSTEQMKLMSKAGVSPLGGCIPTLLIMPVLIAMYNFFPSSIELRQEGFLWASDLSTYDSIWNFPNGFTLPFYGNHVSLFTLLMTVTSIIYAVTNAQLTGSNQGPMKYMPYIFPIMLLGMFNSFPAALTYFYFLNNLISYAQQFLIQKFLINEDALHKQIQENKKKGPNPNSFGEKLRKRLEEAQKQQQTQRPATKPAPKKK
ncbi:MAG: membrane protein insertase YidC [Chitinophagales bacterium]|nr:membrane protein insertase YidC [Chitinophagales bacterium]